MRRVIVESPFGGDVERNLRYLRACMADCLARGESPYASHALYTQPGVLDDTKPDERTKGIAAGFVWRRAAHATVFYLDLGTSRGMELGMADALGMAAEPGCENHVIEVRRLGGEWACP